MLKYLCRIIFEDNNYRIVKFKKKLMIDFLYIKISNSSFIKLDEEILSRHFRTKSFLMNNRGIVAFIWSIVRLSYFLIVNLPFSKALYIRFADHYSFLPALFCKVFHKKLIVVVGGYDAVHIPEYGYGVYHSKIRGFCARYTFKQANLILPNNPTLVENINTFSNDYPRKEGVKHFVPDIKAPKHVVYNGFKANFWENFHFTDRNKVLTVAFINDKKTFYLKGIDLFFKVAEKMPDIPFEMVGLNFNLVHKMKLNVPINVRLIPQTSADELKLLYNHAKVFALFSLTEGMPNVLCEAMLCGCIPVGSNVNAIPEIIGDTGIVVGKKDISILAEAISSALKLTKDAEEKARERILNNFTIERREQELISVLCPMIK